MVSIVIWRKGAEGAIDKELLSMKTDGKQIDFILGGVSLPSVNLADLRISVMSD